MLIARFRRLKNIFFVFLFGVSAAGFFAAGEACASVGDTVDYPRRLTVAAETSSSDGVLVCRPDPSEAEIFNIICEKKIDNLRAYSRWLAGTITYKSDDTTKSWVSWRQTLQRKYGDCKGFALFNYSFLKVLGYNPRLIALTGHNYGHAICACEEDDCFVWFDNEKLKVTQARTLQEFAQSLMAASGCAYVSEIQKETNREEVLLTRPQLQNNDPASLP